MTVSEHIPVTGPAWLATAIETAAKTFFEYSYFSRKWGDVHSDPYLASRHDRDREYFREDAAKVILAALPIIRNGLAAEIEADTVDCVPAIHDDWDRGFIAEQRAAARIVRGET